MIMNPDAARSFGWRPSTPNVAPLMSTRIVPGAPKPYAARLMGLAANGPRVLIIRRRRQAGSFAGDVAALNAGMTGLGSWLSDLVKGKPNPITDVIKTVGGVVGGGIVGPVVNTNGNNAGTAPVTAVFPTAAAPAQSTQPTVIVADSGEDDGMKKYLVPAVLAIAALAVLRK